MEVKGNDYSCIHINDLDHIKSSCFSKTGSFFWPEGRRNKQNESSNLQTDAALVTKQLGLGRLKILKTASTRFMFLHLLPCDMID